MKGKGFVKGDRSEYAAPECAEAWFWCDGMLMGSRFDDDNGSEYIGDNGDIYF